MQLDDSASLTCEHSCQVAKTPLWQSSSPRGTCTSWTRPEACMEFPGISGHGPAESHLHDGESSRLFRRLVQLRRIPQLVICLIIVASSEALIGRPAVGQTRVGPLIGPSAVVPRAEWRPAGTAPRGESAGNRLPPLTREQYKAELLHWARVGMVVGLVTGAVFAVAHKPSNATQRAWTPMGDMLVITIAAVGGGVTGMALFEITHGRPPPR